MSKSKEQPVDVEKISLVTKGLPDMAPQMTRRELGTLSSHNDEGIPKAVLMMRPRRMEWVGIGWIDSGEPRGDETVIIK
jgi:hypothetical protein